MAPFEPRQRQPPGGPCESGLGHFPEFRSKTEFSDLPIARNRPKSKVFPLADRGPFMAPPLPKNERNRISGGIVLGRTNLGERSKGPITANEIGIMKASNARVSEVFGLLAVDLIKTN